MINSKWKEVVQVEEENRHELILSGAVISKRIATEGLDDAIFALIGLNYLNISDTCLPEIPEAICGLINLCNLVLHSNKIRTLTPAIGKLTKLKNIDVSRNLLEEFPEEVNQLQNLYSLNASFNNLKKFPCIIQVSKLTILDLSNNSLENFPDICHDELSHLSEINLKSNCIDNIPAAIRALSSLKILNVSENKLKEVPGELCDISKLKEVNLKGNPLADKRLGKLVVQSHSKPKQVLDYIRLYSKRSAENSVDSMVQITASGKKPTPSEFESLKDANKQQSVDQLCHRITVMHVTDNSPVVVVDEDVKSVRPYIVCCLVKNLRFTDNSFKLFIKLQTRLHENICKNRQAATLATHDLGSIPPGPLKYVARPPQEVVIQPLGSSKDAPASLVFSRLQKEAHSIMVSRKRSRYSGIHKYLYLLDGKSMYPFLLDSSDRVLSFPPLTNSNVTRMSVQSTSMLVEVTSSESQAICRKVLDSFLMECLNLGIGKQLVKDETPENYLTVEQIQVMNASGSLQVVYPSRIDLIFDEHCGVDVIRNLK